MGHESSDDDGVNVIRQSGNAEIENMFFGTITGVKIEFSGGIQ